MPLFAVYGTLRQMDTLKSGGIFLGVERIGGWEMYDRGAYPYVVKGEGRITVEVYRIEDSAILSVLDAYEGHPRLFKRTMVDTRWGEAWMYYMEGRMDGRCMGGRRGMDGRCMGGRRGMDGREMDGEMDGEKRMEEGDRRLYSGDYLLEKAVLEKGKNISRNPFRPPRPVERCVIETPLGYMGAELLDDIVLSLTFNVSKKPTLRTWKQISPTHPLFIQLNEYFAGERKHFSISFLLRGTEFQKRVWMSAMEIPYGETRTYGEVAEAIGKPRSSRAVGNALGVNLLPIIVPCHRVVSSSGIGGFSAGLWRKKAILTLENTGELPDAGDRSIRLQ